MIACITAAIIVSAVLSPYVSAGQYGLHDAVRNGDMADVEKLIVEGADIDRRDKSGATPLMLGADRGDYNIVVMLISEGADVGLRDREGRTALMHAAVNGHVYVGRALIAAGADPGARDDTGADAKGLAHINGQTAMAEALLNAEKNRENELGSMRKELEKLYAEGRYDEAAALGEKILEERMRTSGSDGSAKALAAQDLGAVYEALEDYSRAEENYRIALGIRERTLGGRSPLTAETLGRLGALNFSMGRLKDAEELFSRALSINRAVFGPDHPVTAQSMRDMAALLKRTGRNSEAENLLEKAGKTSGTLSVTAAVKSGSEPLAPAQQDSASQCRQCESRTSIWVGLVTLLAVPALLFVLYKSGLMMRIIRWSPIADRRLIEWFEARTVFADACRAEREGRLAAAAVLYEQVLDLNPANHRARFQFARLLEHGLKNKLAARRQYAILRKKLPVKHAYYKEAVEAIEGFDRDGLL